MESSSENEESQFDLDASLTESDSSDDSNEEESASDNEQMKPTHSKAEILKEEVLQRYQERQGKQLYIRFPKKIPSDDAEFEKKTKALSPLITEVHKPRQKHARFCLVDFGSKEDRDQALQNIRSSAKGEESFKGITASIPRTENIEFVQELAERKLKSMENKKAKARLKRASKLAERGKKFTSSIVVTNLPKNTSTAEVRKLFPKSVDIQVKPGKGKMHGATVATITLPSTMEAREAAKQKLSLSGTQLAIRFDTKKLNKKNSKTKLKKKKSILKNNSNEQNYNKPTIALK